MSINVPDEKAKAVIDAMEREMMDKLATKSDFASFRELVSKDLQMVATDMKHLRSDLESRMDKVKTELALTIGSMLAGTVVLICTILGTMIALR